MLYGVLHFASLATEQTDPAQSETSELEVTMLINQQVVGFEITGEQRILLTKCSTRMKKY